MLQDVIQRSTAADVAAEKEPEKEKPVAEVEVKSVSSLSLEDRFARASSTSKYVARGAGGGYGSSMSGGGVPKKKSLEEEYPTLGVAVAKSTPAPVSKK